MQHQKMTTVAGESFLIVQFSPTKSLRLLTRLVKIVGGPLADFAVQGGLSGDQSEKFFGHAIASLADRLDEDFVESTIKEILSAVHVNNVPVTQDFDARFQGKLGLIFKLCQESLKVQYGDFSSALAQLGSVGGLGKVTSQK